MEEYERRSWRQETGREGKRSKWKKAYIREENRTEEKEKEENRK